MRFGPLNPEAAVRRALAVFAGVVVATLCICSHVTAAERDVERAFASETLGEDVALSVRLPASYGNGDDSYPVLYVIEHDLYFRAITGTVEAYARLGRAPEMIVVGVGTNDRWRDFTPTRAGIPDGDEIANSGGARSYLDFLLSEVAEYVESGYRTQPFSVLFGHSAAGLFAVWVALSGEADFGACIATSPSLWWDDEFVLRNLTERAGAAPGRARHFYIATGSEGETVAGPAARLATALVEGETPTAGPEDALAAGESPASRPAEGFVASEPDRPRVTYEEFPTADHQTMPLRAFAAGLDFVFEGWELPAEIREAGFEAVSEHYANLTATYGYDIRVPERLANWYGYRELAAGNVDEAIRIFEANVGAYPGSANAYDSLGEAWLEAGDEEKARANYARSLELDPTNENARSVLTELEHDDQ